MALHPDYTSFDSKLTTIFKNSELSAEEKALDICKYMYITVSDQGGPQVTSDVSREAFNVAYAEGDGTDVSALKDFVRYVKDELIAKYNREPENYHSLYGSIIQSSGYGKSRLVLEAGQKDHLNVVYGCSRHQGSAGYPPSNKKLNDILGSLSTLVDYERFIIACYFAAASFACVPRSRKPLKELAGDDYLFTEYWEKVHGLLDEYRKANGSLWETDKTKFKALQRHYHTNKDRCYKNRNLLARVSAGQKTYDILTELVIVFDEAKHLLEGEESKFRRLRRAHRGLKCTNVVLIFIDTLGKISNFMPATFMDPSYRYGGNEFNLLRTYYALLTADSLALKLTSADELDSRFAKLAEAFSHGRPMWRAYFFSRTEPRMIGKADVDTAIGFAQQKLTFSRYLEQSLLNDAKIAVSSIRFGIFGVLDHTLATQLMSSYMGTGILSSTLALC